ncbi:hypothetical protein ACFRK5_34265 [Streptomyces niveus]|uniref:hypothetical protein n=1 Tax=Streptomyces niveus TaxID=193462 RepID=UPI0036D1DD62
MNILRTASRIGARAIVLGITATALTAALPAAAQAAPAPRAAGTILCNSVDVDLPGVFGRECSSEQWGPISEFTVTNRESGEKFSCESGWSEGTLWLKGDGCTPA